MRINNFFAIYTAAMALEMFAALCEENADKLHMPKPVNYPLNYKLGKKWADQQGDPESREFANNIITGTQYISYGQFIYVLHEIIEGYLSKATLGPAYVLVVPFSFEKSNVWVSMLAFQKLKPIITDIYYDITSVFNDSRRPGTRLYGRQVHCIVCDDCAYTGTQLIDHVTSFDLERVVFETKHAPPSVHDPLWLEWHAKTRNELALVIAAIDPNQFSVDLFIPYISVLASERVRNVHYIRIPKKAVIFPIFTQRFDVERLPLPIQNEFKRTFQYHRDISAIYFDHKVADGLSTFNKIYLLAPLFNCVPPNQSIGFIEGCPRQKLPADLNSADYIPDVERRVDVCPPTYYKRIDYTFRGEKINRRTMLHNLHHE